MSAFARPRYPAWAPWLLVAALLPSLVFAGGLHRAAEAAAPGSDTHSYAEPEAADDTLRQCLPDPAPCNDLPAAAAAAVMSLSGDVIAAVASDTWRRVAGIAPPGSRDVTSPPGTEPPRTS